MNKKAAMVVGESIAIIIVILFLVGMIYFVLDKRNGGGVIGDEYSKKIAGIIDVAEPGEVVQLDVHRLTKVAVAHRVELDKIFTFDNTNNIVCIQLSQGIKNCYTYFNDVSVVGVELEEGVPGNQLTFKITNKVTI